ncbi:MAG TPA: hypothetical protein VE987_21225 [Polyangiaceae bacterium]|nr:hypothetical protein [Polyangiaceae bacterium]
MPARTTPTPETMTTTTAPATAPPSRRAVSVTCGLLACALGACGGLASPGAPRSADAGATADGGAAALVLVGDVPGTDARVGIVATADHARLFFCGGASSVLSLTHWFSADIGATQRIAFDAGMVQPFAIDGSFGPGGATGTVVLADGQSRVFEASPVAAGTIAGVYEADSSCGKVGLIVTQPSAGATAMGQGACVPTAAPGAPAQPILQVNPLEPIVRAADGTIVVTVVGETGSVALRAAAPPAP